MAWGDKQLRGTEESSASKLPITLGRSRWTLNLTVLKDAFRMSSFSRVAHAQSQAGNSGVATLTGSAGVVI
jgi:hypothetical protein